MENIVTIIVTVTTSATTIISLLIAIIGKFKAIRQQIQKEGLVETVKKLDIKDVVTKLVVEAEQKFEYGDNLSKLTWVIENTQKILGSDCTIATDIRREVEDALSTIQNFQKKKESIK